MELDWVSYILGILTGGAIAVLVLLLLVIISVWMYDDKTPGERFLQERIREAGKHRVANK